MRIAEDGSLTRAAGILRVAQPALSRQMRLLEEELGVTLFRRVPRGMQLTEEGEYLRNAAAGPLRQLDMVLQNIRSLHSSIEANFSLGMPSNLTDLLAKPLTMAVHEQFPNINFRIIEGFTGNLADWLNRGIADFAFLEETVRNGQLREQKILALPFALAGPPDSPLETNQPLTLEAVLQLPLLLPSHHLGIRGMINDALAQQSTKPDIRFEADSSLLLKELVASGMGYTLLPDRYFQQEVAAGKLRRWELVGPSLHLDILLASRTNSQIAGRQFSEVEKVISDLAFDVLNTSPLQQHNF